MAKKPEPSEQAPKQIEWPSAKGFKESWKAFKSDALKEAMKAFNEHKRANPPKPLPRGMKDHKLTGPLKDYMECHLEGDALLIYKPLPGGAIKLMRICTHDEIRGPRGKALAVKLKDE
jgi:mRNA interferase YafQ